MSIVISGSITLSEDEQNAGVNNNNPRIGYHNVINATNITSEEADVGYPLSNLANPATSLRWKGETDSEQHITVSLNEGALVNYFAVYGHNLGSTGAEIVLQSSDDGENWTSRSTPRTLGSNYAFMEEFDNVTAQYFRLKITPPGSVDPPEIAVLYIGQVLRVQRRMFVGHKPITLSRKTKTNTGRSEAGQFLGRVKRGQFLQTEASFNNLTQSWVRTYLDPFIVAAETQPFFFAWRPADHPTEVALAWLEQDPEPDNALGNGMMSVSLALQGVR